MLHNASNYGLCGTYPRGAVGMINDNLGTQGYQVVRTLYDNLQWLHYLCENLPQLHHATGLVPYLEAVVKNAGYLESLTQHLDTVVRLENNLPLVQDLAPRIEAFKKELEALNTRLENQQLTVDSMNDLLVTGSKNLSDIVLSTKKTLDDMVQARVISATKELKAIECKVKEETRKVEDLSAQLQLKEATIQALFKQVDTNAKFMAHLDASDKTNNYLWSGSEDDRQLAKKAISYSQRAGNNEDVNLNKLKAVSEDLNMFKMLNQRHMELAHKQRKVGMGDLSNVK